MNNMKGSARNLPCWCGSGKKFKICHWNRDRQEKASLWEVEATARKLYEIKTCLHPQAAPSTCRPPMVRAHTVRRSADLKAIARKGHVYRGSADVKTLDQTGGRIVPKLVGINSASTFWGFCHAHDTLTFSPLETKPIGLTDEQAFLLAYRPLAMELYLKQRSLDGLELMRSADKGLPLELQHEHQLRVRFMEAGLTSAVQDLQYHKVRLDRDLLASDFSRIRFVAVHLDRAPELMCSGVVQPQYTFDGKLIQDIGDLNRTSRFISFSLLATETGGAGIFSWPSESDKESAMLVDSLLALPLNDIPAALVRFAFSNLENVFCSPDWWESLPESTAEFLVDRINHAVNDETEPDALCDDGERPVEWVVTRIQQKRA